MRNITTEHYVRISKKTARRLYKVGFTKHLYLCPVNLNPESPWGLLYWPGNNETPFDTLVHQYEAYNCTGSETGRYTAFYVPREWWELVNAAANEFEPFGPAFQALQAWEAVNK